MSKNDVELEIQEDDEEVVKVINKHIFNDYLDNSFSVKRQVKVIIPFEEMFPFYYIAIVDNRRVETVIRDILSKVSAVLTPVVMEHSQSGKGMDVDSLNSEINNAILVSRFIESSFTESSKKDNEAKINEDEASDELSDEEMANLKDVHIKVVEKAVDNSVPLPDMIKTLKEKYKKLGGGDYEE